MIKTVKTALIAAAAFACANAFAAEYTMTCDEALSGMDRELTAEANTRFDNLRGSCLGVVERGGELYAHTQMVVRRVRGNTITLYVPATDRTFDTEFQPMQRIRIANQRVRVRDLSRGQELNLYLNVEQFTQPIIREVAFQTEEEDAMIIAPAAVVAALPTTG